MTIVRRACAGILSAALLFAAVVFGTESRASAAAALTIDSRIEWHPPASASTDDAACDAAKNPPGYTACRILVMRANGASPQAVVFARMLSAQRGFFGYAQHVDAGRYGPIARVATLGSGISTYASGYYAGPNLELTSTEDDRYDARLHLARNPTFRALLAAHPQATLWEQSSPVSELRRPGGGQRFVSVRPIVDGCHACKLLGAAQVGYDFDAAGRFVSTVLLDVRAGEAAWFKPRALSPAAGAIAAPNDFSTLRVTGIDPARVWMSVRQLRDQGLEVAGGGRIAVRVPLLSGRGCEFSPTSSLPGVGVMFTNGRATRFDVTTREIPTDRGIRVGDSAATLIKVYRTLRATRDIYIHGGTDYEFAPGPPFERYRLTFITDGKRVLAVYGGRLPEVRYVEHCF